MPTSHLFIPIPHIVFLPNLPKLAINKNPINNSVHRRYKRQLGLRPLSFHLFLLHYDNHKRYLEIGDQIYRDP